MARLMIVDDARMLAEMLATALAREAGLQLVGLAHDAPGALQLAAQARPDIILLEIQLPGANGLELIAPLRQKLPAVKIIILSACLNPCTAYRVVQSGVQGYVEKCSPLGVLREAVRGVLQGRTFFSPGFVAMQTRLLKATDAFHKILSEREQMILQLMAEGCSDAEIARTRGIAEQSVATNRKRIRTKLALHSDRELLVYARRWGLGSNAAAT